MGKEKRKGRLDKSSGAAHTDFIGFSSFSSVTDHTHVNPKQQATTTPSSGWSPVYTGSDDALQILFPRLGHKRDATTKTKALEELQTLLSASADSPSSIRYANDRALRRVQVEALQHYAWLYFHKLHYDLSPAVRSGSLKVWLSAEQRLPKAVAQLFSTSQPELLGMIYTASHADRGVAKNVSQAVVSLMGTHTEWPWERGLLDLYAGRILSYGRPSRLFEALYAPSSSKKGGQTQKASTGGKDADNEMAEEQFERIVGTCLDAIKSWVSTQPVEPEVDTSLWWKVISNQKPVLRLQTLRLLMVSCQKKVSVPISLQSILVQLVSTEKDVTNIPNLLDAIAAYASYIRDSHSESSDSLEAFTKPIAKTLKKACYGSPASLWAPSLLPLSAMLGKSSPKVFTTLLAAAWEGRSLVLGGDRDRCVLACAVAESTSFWLLRARREDDDSSDDLGETVQTVVDLWLATFHYVLTSSPPSSPTSPLGLAHAKLINQVVADMQRFHEAFTGGRTGSAFGLYMESKWFWGEGLKLSESNMNTLSTFLLCCQGHDLVHSLLPQVSPYFHQTLKAFQTRSGSVPSIDVYEFLIVALKSFTARDFFESDDALSKFVMNDLLRWMILHTSELSHTQQDALFVKHDFTVLFYCLLGNASRNELVESIFRELIRAKCDLRWFSDGLFLLVALSDGEVAWLRSPTLSEFAVAMGTKAVTEFQQTVGSPVPSQRRRAVFISFFRVCLGFPAEIASTCLDESMSKPTLVETRVIHQWIEAATVPLCTNSSPTLDILISFVISQNAGKLPRGWEISDDGILKVVEQAWRIGSEKNDKELQSLLQSNARLEQQAFTSFPRALSSERTQLLNGAENDRKGIMLWASRAYRLMKYIACSSEMNKPLATAARSSIILQSDEQNSPFALWVRHPKEMFAMTQELFSLLPDATQRLSVVVKDPLAAPCDFDQETVTLFLTNLVRDDSSSTVCDRLRKTASVTRLVKSLVGEGGLNGEILVGVSEKLLDSLSSKIKTSSDSHKPEIDPLITSYLLVLQTIYKPVIDDSFLGANEISEGQMLSYIMNPEELSSIVDAKVKKVHFDGQAGYYYTIELQGDKAKQERQTVLSRLRKCTHSSCGMECPLVEGLASDNFRENSRKLLHSLAIKPILSTSARTCVSSARIGSLVAALGGITGFNDEKGLGSARYDCFQLLKALDAGLGQELSSGNIPGATHLFLLLAYCMGYDMNGSTLKWSHRCFTVDMGTTCAILDRMYRDHRDQFVDLAAPASLWLAMSMEHQYPQDLDSGLPTKPGQDPQAIRLLFQLCSSVFEKSAMQRNTNTSLVASLAFREGLKWSGIAKNDAEAMDAIVNASTGLLHCFDTLDFDGVQRDVLTPEVVLRELIEKPNLAQHVVKSLASKRECFLSMLFLPGKRALAYRLLLILMKSSAGASVENSTDFAFVATKREWLSGLSEDEASEIEEDIEIVSDWVAPNMMRELESWASYDLESMDEIQAFGQLLVWLLTLEVLEQAAADNFRNRSAFISYLSKCGAFSHIMNVALLNETTINGSNGKSSQYEKLLNNQSAIGGSNVSTAASATLFRSIGVLPASARRWWEEECPRVYISPMQAFVEKFVGPQILKNELSRVKSNPQFFGDMAVSASSISREIKAEYVQDDFTLKVVITLPAAFPFRSADVDCSKTLGVPASRWKRWSLQIMMMLNSQGGTLADALMLWKDNVDKEFEGVEPCPVCFSVLHAKTHKLPSLQCKTCSNRFHVECLTQWFRSSGKSQCVLCQQPWEGTRV